MSVGTTIRLNRIFSDDNRSFIVAMDHGAIIGPQGNIAHPREIIELIGEGKPDAILTTKGMLKAACSALQPEIAVILRITGGFTMLSNPADFRDLVISSVDQAIKYGADGVAVTVKYGHQDEGEFISNASFIADECSDWGIPLMIEVWPAGPNVSKPAEPKAVKLGARAAAEIGADIIKTYYTGDKDSFLEVTDGCPVPVVILGGAKKDSNEDLFAMIRDSLDAGGAGVAMGRNVWGYKSPLLMTKAIRGLIHEGLSVEEAMLILRENK
jgi:fructose-bisphosphate aldolase/2-amino-3,7-dideoxy-D-threo-hept-6-ulosonate synthase